MPEFRLSVGSEIDDYWFENREDDLLELLTRGWDL